MFINKFPREWDSRNHSFSIYTHIYIHLYINNAIRACCGSCSISSVTTYCLLVFRDYGSIASLALSHGTLSMLEECTEHYFEPVSD